MLRGLCTEGARRRKHGRTTSLWASPTPTMTAADIVQLVSSHPLESALAMVGALAIGAGSGKLIARGRAGPVGGGPGRHTTATTSSFVDLPRRARSAAAAAEFQR